LPPSVPSPAASSPRPTTRSPFPPADQLSTGFFRSRHHQPAMKKFLTTAPVFAAIWFTATAGILIEFNRFFPDLLFHPM
jgi:photosystem I subunit IX